MAKIRKSTTSNDVYDIVTNQILEDAKKKQRLPWQIPWIFDVRTGNIGSSYTYRILNRMLVSHAGRYMTFKYMTEHNIDIIKPDDWDERFPDDDFDSLDLWSKFMHLCDIIFGKFKKQEPVVDKNGDPALNDDGTPKMRTWYRPRYWRVLWEGYTTANSLDKYDEPVERINSCEYLLNYYTNREGIKLVEVLDDKAYFQPSNDTVHLPKASQFRTIQQYYATAFHEITHSTGTKTRLNRDQSGRFGSKQYAREELVAELGSAFLSAYFGIRTDNIEKNNSAYVQSWLKALENDHRLIVDAADYADKAVKFILDGFEEPKEEPKKEPKEDPKPSKPVKTKRYLLGYFDGAKEVVAKQFDGYDVEYDNTLYFVHKSPKGTCWQVSCPRTGRLLTNRLISGWNTRKEAIDAIHDIHPMYIKSLAKGVAEHEATFKKCIRKAEKH